MLHCHGYVLLREYTYQSYGVKKNNYCRRVPKCSKVVLKFSCTIFSNLPILVREWKCLTLFRKKSGTWKFWKNILQILKYNLPLKETAISPPSPLLLEIVNKMIYHRKYKFLSILENSNIRNWNIYILVHVIFYYSFIKAIVSNTHKI